jgi:hypothetical protein
LIAFHSLPATCRFPARPGERGTRTDRNFKKEALCALSSIFRAPVPVLLLLFLAHVESEPDALPADHNERNRLAKVCVNDYIRHYSNMT